MDTQWIEKYKREYWTMSFGSMCNAYGQVMSNKAITMPRFLVDMEEIYKLSQELIAKSLEEKPVEPAELKKVKDFLKKVETNKTPEQLDKESEGGDRLLNS